MYAIFENGSKQYKVSVGDLLKVEKLDAAIGSAVQFPVVLTADENGVKAGKEVEKVQVVAEVVSQGKEKKIIVFKYKAKKNERKKQGHRQPYLPIKKVPVHLTTAETATPKCSESSARTVSSYLREIFS